MNAVWMALVFVVLPQALAAGPNGQVRVSDGDSFVVAGQRVRLFGIDAHELDQNCTHADGREIACGVWARDWAEARFEGRFATCRTLKYDQYERALATCQIDGEDVGETMLRAGIVATYPRETLRDYLDYEKEAQLLGRGIWAWDSENPIDHRTAQRAPANNRAEAGFNGCAIKGNISSGGRIYHLPGQENYARTQINTSKGERWFCSETDAQKAGWRRARR